MLKGRKMFTTTLKKELYDILRNMSKATGIPMTRLLDEAVTHLIEARNDQYVSARTATPVSRLADNHFQETAIKKKDDPEQKTKVTDEEALEIIRILDDQFS